MNRFKVMSISKAFAAIESGELSDPEYLVEDFDEDYDWGDVLVDAETNAVIYRDGGEPEDQILRRDLGFFVERMNDLASESGGDD